MKGVLVVGAAVVDIVFYLDQIPQEAKKYRADAAAVVGGGNAANAAVAITRLGGQAHLGGRLGNDTMGDLIADGLQGDGVDVSFLNRSPGGVSSYSTVCIDKSGERQIINFRGAGLITETAWLKNAPQVAAVLVDTRWVDGAVAALNLARERGLPGIVDAEAPVDSRILAIASHVIFSRQGLMSVSDEANLELAMLKVSSTLSAFCGVTDGGDGSLYVREGKVVRVPAFAVEVVDSLGAGDVWHGAFALKLAEGGDESKAFAFANAAAAIKCTRRGGRQGCPSRAETEQFLLENLK